VLLNCGDQFSLNSGAVPPAFVLATAAQLPACKSIDHPAGGKPPEKSTFNNGCPLTKMENNTNNNRVNSFFINRISSEKLIKNAN
jgi:hypothetical protein